MHQRIFMSFLNKIFLIQSVYCPKTMKFIINSTHTKLEIIDKVTKANIIQNTFVKDPYFILITDQKIYIYFIFDIQRCIESILAQTFADFELLLIDDGSKDKSGEICDNYALKDKRIKVFHKQNGGVCSFLI